MGRTVDAMQRLEDDVGEIGMESDAAMCAAMGTDPSDVGCAGSLSMLDRANLEQKVRCCAPLISSPQRSCVALATYGRKSGNSVQVWSCVNVKPLGDERDTDSNEKRMGLLSSISMPPSSHACALLTLPSASSVLLAASSNGSILCLSCSPLIDTNPSLQLLPEQELSNLHCGAVSTMAADLATGAFASAGEDGAVHQLQLRAGSLQRVGSIAHASSAGINALAFLSASTCVVTGASKCISLWDLRENNNGSVGSESESRAALISTTCDSELLCMSPLADGNSVVCGAASGCISLWDIRFNRTSVGNSSAGSRNKHFVTSLLPTEINVHTRSSAVLDVLTVPAIGPGHVLSCGQDGNLVLSNMYSQQNTVIDRLNLVVPLNSVCYATDERSLSFVVGSDGAFVCQTAITGD